MARPRKSLFFPCLQNIRQHCMIHLQLQSTLVISKSKGPFETLPDIRTSTYQICRIEENTKRTTKFHKWTCNLTPLLRWGWSGGAMVLGELPVPGRPTIWITVGQGPTALAVGAGGGCLDIFTLIYPFFPLSPSLWETARYRLKYCLKGPLNPKTNQPTKSFS